MPSIACLPGLVLPTPLLACGPWRLLRFGRGQPLVWPSLLPADEIVAKLGGDRAHGEGGATDWTLIVLADQPLGADLDFDARHRLARFGERLSCAALVERTLDQRTDTCAPGVALRLHMHHWQAPLASVQAPWMPPPAPEALDEQTARGRARPFDTALLHALLELDRAPAPLVADIDEALSAYGLAQAPADVQAPAAALVLLGSALRQLYGLEGFGEPLRRRLIADIAALSGPDPDAELPSIEPATGLPAGRLLGHWLDDLFGCLMRIVRHEAAEAGDWTPRSHLRLLGFLFPLLLKARLARLGLYRMNGADIALVGCFEARTAAEPRLVGSSRPGYDTPPATAAYVVHAALAADPLTAAFEDALAWCVNRNLLGPQA